MYRSTSLRALALRTLSSAIGSVVVSCFLLVLVQPGVGQESGAVVAVEEDWEFVVGVPDVNSAGPQVTCAFSPLGHVDSFHATLEINHQSLPAFAPGGLHLQVWNGDDDLASRSFPNTSVMSIEGETVRWTQAMRLENGQLIFEVTNGDSATWGDFDEDHLRYSLATQLANLNDYNPQVSLNNSEAGFAANRVRSLVLKRVRWRTSGGGVTESLLNGVVLQSE